MSSRGVHSAMPESTQGTSLGASDAMNGKRGLISGITAFTLWGLFPMYWHLLEAIPAQEIITHRIVWSVVFLLPLVTYYKCWDEVKDALSHPSTFFRSLLSGMLVAGNWYLYVWAVNSGHVLETSLGYYINPLMNVLTGAIFFRERLNRTQMFAIGLATFGVLAMVIAYGQVPWIGLGLATLFAAYGLLRKAVKVNALPGLFVETLMVMPFAAGWLLWQANHGLGALGHVSAFTTILVLGAGAVTSIPLLCFGYAARNLRLTTVGLLQYITPTLAFIQGIFFFHETVSPANMLTFGCIWLALIVYTVDSWRHVRRVEPNSVIYKK
ncbi:MAG: EamA family transporter RarD [Pseudomonadota bacterium]